jgi:hypothetical protein
LIAIAIFESTLIQFFQFRIEEESSKSTTLTAASTRPASFYPEEVPVSSFSSSDLSGSSTSSGVTCLHNGNVYRHKERFTSSNVGLKPEHADQCVQCSCEVSESHLCPVLILISNAFNNECY